MGSEICRRVQSSQATKVTNMKVFACLVLLVSASVAFPQAKSGCGTNERGVARKPGDNWQEQCNRCRCLESGVPGCTKKFCGSIPGLFAPASKTCKDSDGNIREEGALWEENGSGEVCTCGKGVVLLCRKSLHSSIVREHWPRYQIRVNNIQRRQQQRCQSDCSMQPRRS